jgi:AcrR family transcriptional regulator
MIEVTAIAVAPSKSTHGTVCTIIDVTVPYDRTGRINQKARTRAALIAATRQLLAEGVTPTMEAAAAAAAISRTTAYRYFPNLRALLIATYPHIEQRSLLGSDPPETATERLEIVANDQTKRILTYESEMRAVLRLSLDPAAADPQLPMNRGLRIGWIEDALAPLRGKLPDQELRRLTYGIGATLGIEAFVWLTDIAQVSRDDAAAIMRSSATNLLRATLAAADANNETSPDPPNLGTG